MKAIASVLICLLSILNLNANVKKPDFAYPKQVSQTAAADLAKAETEENAPAAMNAAIRLYLAESLIDPDSLQANIRKVEDVSAKFMGSDFAPMYAALLARMYFNMYSHDRWKYDRRQLPLSPLPSDITEWSGEQFKKVISDLLVKSCSSPDAMDKMKTTDYPDLITIDKVAAPYFPTLQDFALANAYEIYSDLDTHDLADFCRHAIDQSAAIAPKVIWEKTLIEITNNEQDSAEAYQKYADSEYSAPLLEMYANYASQQLQSAYQGRNDADAANSLAGSCTAAIDSFLAKYKSSPFVPNLKNEKANLSQQQMRADFPTLCKPGQEVHVTITTLNADKGYLLVYRKANVDEDYWSTSFAPKSGTLYATIPFECPAGESRIKHTDVKVNIDAPGYYAFVPSATKSIKSPAESRTAARCVPALPLVLAGPGHCYVAVYDPVSGRPIPGVKVLLTNSKTKVEAGITDSDGLTDISMLATANSDRYIGLSIGGNYYPFKRVSVSRPNNSDLERHDANIAILTDRSLYHPGDTIHFLAIAHQAKRANADTPTENRVVPGCKLGITLYDANYQKVESLDGLTDEYGRVSGSFALPTSGLTGNFSIRADASINGRQIYGSDSFMVSDYRMPDFKLDVEPAQLATPRPGCVTIKGCATSYSGAPVGGTSVEAILRISRGWRFLLGAGTDPVYSATAVAAGDGSFSIEIPDSVFSAQEAKSYTVSLNATSPAGSTADASLFFSLGKQYAIEIGAIPANVNGTEPLRIPVSVTNTAGGDACLPLSWSLASCSDNVAGGELTGDIDISAITPGTYTLSVYPDDPALADTVATTICIYNTTTDIVPDGELLWCLSRAVTVAPGSKTATLLVGTAKEEASVYCVTLINGKWRSIRRIPLTKGYHSITIDCDSIVPGSGNRLQLATAADFHTKFIAIDINVEEPKPIQLVGETFRDKLTAGSQETWKIHLATADGQPLQGAVVLDMFNQALSALQSHSISLSPITLGIYPNFRRSSVSLGNGQNQWSSATNRLKEVYLQRPSFNFYGISAYRLYDLSGRMVMMNKAMAYCADGDVVEEEADYAAPTSAIAESDNEAAAEASMPDEDGGSAATDFDYRDADVPMAVWAPTLTTDKEGNLSYTFTVPNANTTWLLLAKAWTKDMRVASLMRTFVASKPVMVMPNPPRFLRAGDCCEIAAQVVNNTDEAATLTTVVEIFNPSTGAIIASHKYKNALDANASGTVTTKVVANADLAAIGYRIRTSNGQFADGEQQAIPVLPSEAQLVETFPFYLNPGEGTYTTTLPKAKEARITLTFTENPVWTIVSALPGLRKEIGPTANSAAAAIFSAAISRGLVKDNPNLADAIAKWQSNPTDSTLISSLSKNEDLKTAMLNATPWVRAAQSDTERMARLALIFSGSEAEKSISAAIASLAKLQKPDGGWAWGEWSSESSVWVTGNVLAMMGKLNTLGYLPADMNAMIDKALDYYDAAMRKDLEHASNKKEVTNMLYSLIRPLFPKKAINATGKTVIDNTIAYILKNWKSMSDPATKAMAAKALFLNGRKPECKPIMKSLSEFGIWSENQGLRFPSVDALYDYAIILDTYATVEPQSPDVDGLRQQLIARKQGDDWGSAVVTSEVVSSILTSGSKWTVQASGADIKAGSMTIKPQSPMETATGQIRADLSKYAGKQLSITAPATGPAYGAVYVQRKQSMGDVKAVSCPDLDIEKSVTVRRGTEWEYTTAPLQVGDRVKVQLTIHCKRNLSYVSIIDERPAAFQPVQQLPGWLFSEGVAFYRENGNSATNLFVEQMSPGTYILSYEMNVGQAGKYSSGVASIQSQYAPELSAHSSGSILLVK